MKQYTDKCFKNFDLLSEYVLSEHLKQVKQWGIQNHSLTKWLTITAEEFGSLAKAINDHECRLCLSAETEIKKTAEDIFKEAIQLATLSLKIAEMFLKEKK